MKLPCFLFLGACWLASVAADAIVEEQVCLANGQCFANDQEAHLHFYPGKQVEMVLEEPHSVTFGEPQQVAGEKWKETLANIAKTKEYMIEVFNNETLRSIRNECKVRNELCAFWAAIGECEANPPYMLMQCAPSCQTCHQLSFEHRCPYDKNAPKVWGPGDLNKMFNRITTEDYYKRYSPVILSKPPEGPWVITLDDVATPEECERMIELGRIKGYERSKDVGEKKFDGTFEAVESKDRTSTNAWCVEECHEDPTSQSVIRKVENITGISDINSEYWQLLQYHETEFYHNHHDYIPHHLQRSQGVRILTAFMYLNEVEAGGGTHFKRLGITVLPKAGRVLLWPSVLDENPDAKDPRTHHEALPVEKGVKYGANAWIHQKDFKTPYNQTCI